MNVLIIADSPLCDIKQDHQHGIDVTICLDGAAAKITSSIQIDYIIGDFDTIERNNIDASALNAKHVKITEQDSTDLEKGIDYALSLGASSISIVNALGGRADHSLYNLSMLKKYHKRIDSIYIINESEQIHYIANTAIDLTGTIGAPVALLPFPSAAISSEGLAYDMDNFQIEIGKSASVSNALNKANVMISVQGEALLVCDRSIVKTG